MKQLYLSVVALLFFTSCHGQAKKNLSKEKVVTNKVRAKIPKVRGTFQDASVGCALQDKTGNFWFGTNGEGLFRYDGKTFMSFRENDGLDNLFVYSLLEDKKGNIWIGTRTGLYCYDARLNNSPDNIRDVQEKSITKVSLAANGAQNFLMNTANKKTPSSLNGVWSMMQDKKGIIWLGTDDGVYCYNGISFTFFLDNTIINKDSRHLKSIFSFLEDKKGNIWFGSCIGEGLIRFDGESLKRISPKGYARTQGLAEDKNGNIWFASIGKGMCQYSTHRNDSLVSGNIITTNFFKEKDTYDLLYIIFKDNAERLWFSEPANNRSVCYYDGKELIHFSERYHLPDSKMYPVLEDHNGNIWFAAYGMKLYRWNASHNDGDGQKNTFSDFSE